MKIGDYENAHRLIEDIFEESFKEFSVEIVKCMMFDLVGTFIKVAGAINDVNFIEKTEPFKRLTECASVTEMKGEIYTMLELLCGYKKQNINNTNHFGLSPAYLSRLFKNRAKERLLDIINKIRLEKAKEFLKKDNITVKEVSDLVGFSHSSVFIRTFKNYEGITPGQFKEIL